MDPVYGFQACNVGAQRRNELSMLHWVRRFIAVRKRFPVFGEGTFEALDAANPSVFAFVRTLDDQVVLCVNNLSRFAQPVELDLRKYAGTTPVEMLGRVHFPRIGELPYLLDDGAARLLLVHARPGDIVSASNGSLDELLHDHRLEGCETALGDVHRAAALGAVRTAAPYAAPRSSTPQ